MAAERPPALKAIVASDDRYTDDVHYTGGALKLLDLVDYPLYMVALNALPPVPAIAGPDWRARWRERVEGLEPWLLRWVEEQADGPYWRQGLLRPDYERIACPTMLVAGWADGYRNATFRVLERLAAPCRLLFGPWEPHGHRHLPARAADRPGPRDGPLVGPLAAGPAQRRRPGPAGDRVRAPRHPARPRPRRAGRGVARRAGLAPRAGPLPDPGPGRRDPGRRRPRPAGGAGDGRRGGLDQLRRAPAVRAAGRPARGRRLVAGVRLAARPGAGAARPPAAGGPGRVVGAGGVPVGQAVRRVPGRDLGPGRAGVPQPDPAAVVDRPRADGAGGGRGGRARAGRDLVGVPGRAPAAAVAGRVGLAEPGAAAGAGDPHGGPPWVGPHPAGARRAEPEPTALAPPSPPARPGRAARRRAPRPPPTRWRVVRDVLGRGSEAEIDHGGRSELPDGTVLVERYRGTVGAQDRPGSVWARGTADYRVEWPEATVATSARLDLRGDADAFEVRLDLEAREGDELPWTRTWHRRIPRHLA